MNCICCFLKVPAGNVTEDVSEDSALQPEAGVLEHTTVATSTQLALPPDSYIASTTEVSF